MSYEDGNDLKSYIPGFGFLVTSTKTGENHIFEIEERSNPAYEAGYKARKTGQQIGSNPFDTEAQPEEFESWLDGWSLEDPTRYEPEPPVFNCLDCDCEIEQEGTPIAGTDVLGYYRYCEKCRDIEPHSMPIPE